MRKMLWVLAATGLVACGDKDGTDSGDAAGADGGVSAEDQATAEALWTEIDGFESWPQVDPWIGVVESTSVHLDQVQIWANQSSYDTITAAAGGDMPDGAINIKAAYRDGESDPANYTVMKKTGGAWFYARYSPSGDVELAGESALDACQGCHSGGQDEVLFATW
jgi:hypothetical protein